MSTSSALFLHTHTHTYTPAYTSGGPPSTPTGTHICWHHTLSSTSSYSKFFPGPANSCPPLLKVDFPGGPVAKIGRSPLTHSPKGYQTSIVAKSIPSDATKDLDTPRHSMATTLCPSPASTSHRETSRQWAVWAGDTTRRLVAWRWDLETNLKEKGAPESFSLS